jgi:hypothetical protein
VQDSLNQPYLGILYSSLYDKTNIIVPHSIKLSDKDFKDTFKESIRSYISSEMNNLNHKFDFLLIHYSILERMFKSDIDQINNYLSELSLSINVIVTSGRGTPDNLTKDVRFVNLSPIVTAFVEIRSKYLSNCLLHSTRKSNRI